MKKAIVFLVVCGLISTLHAQITIETLSDKGGSAPSGTRTILCPPTSIYSHEISYYNAISSQEGHAIYWDQIETAPGAPISQVIFYGIVTGTPDRNYTINFYHNDGGIPGALLSSNTDFIAGVNTGEILFDKVIYSYTYNLPSSVVLDAGDWISVVAANGDMWYWLNGSGGDGCVYNNYIGEWCPLGDVAFCLVGNLGGEEVPVAPWALGIGIALIVAAALLRYRKII